MANSCSASFMKVTFIFALTTCMIAVPVLSTEFQVGGDHGWKIPSSKSGPQMYNQWASKNRFQVGDVVRFKYDKDSVMEVTEKEYESCKSVHPIYFSNNGNTELKLDHSGDFYFISGISGHCERGQKMIIKVMSHSDAPGTSPPAPPSPDESSAARLLAFAPLHVLALLLLAINFF
uniref:Phytocyanin domain-containing protein n=1 Tax=Amblyomma maculatum TaxID=34609 RepID=G3MT85_AMBMU